MVSIPVVRNFALRKIGSGLCATVVGDLDCGVTDDDAAASGVVLFKRAETNAGSCLVSEADGGKFCLAGTLYTIFLTCLGSAAVAPFFELLGFPNHPPCFFASTALPFWTALSGLLAPIAFGFDAGLDGGIDVTAIRFSA
mmetsp:Transcript_33774/g.87798  ORF Transcript_33774/g.87798 Transcript_33774/m.87798 type:complete len:140 (+) Transcript_33774:145-564(+)